MPYIKTASQADACNATFHTSLHDLCNPKKKTLKYYNYYDYINNSRLYILFLLSDIFLEMKMMDPMLIHTIPIFVFISSSEQMMACLCI